MLYRFWQFSRQAQIEQYLFSVPTNLAPPNQRFPAAVAPAHYPDKELKSRELIDIPIDCLRKPGPRKASV
jgi:hypothetical protein